MHILLVHGDITVVKSDVIVNAANSALAGGGGVDGAIHRAGGDSIAQECQLIIEQQGSCPPGEAVITTAGNLPARFVVHTVGPIWYGGTKNERELLKNAYKNSLLLAEQHGASSVAFPNISTGVYGFPKEEAARIALRTVVETSVLISTVTRVLFVCFDLENFTIYKRLISETSFPDYVHVTIEQA